MSAPRGDTVKKILILEDEDYIRSFVMDNLRRAGYDLLEATNGQQALDLLAEHEDVDAAVLDITVPDMDGFELCRQIRLQSKTMGLLLLVDRYQEMDKVTGLMTGGDDYVTKPFSSAELCARMDAVLRRIRGQSVSVTELLSSGPFILNVRNHTLEKLGQRIRLTLAEYAMVKLFLQNPGRALSQEDILYGVWGKSYDGDIKIVDTSIRRLRIKLEDDPNRPTFITTVWGYGYQWEK